MTPQLNNHVHPDLPEVYLRVQKAGGIQAVRCALGTNVKCTPMTKVDLPDSGHMCSKHMVKQGKDEMHR